MQSGSSIGIAATAGKGGEWASAAAAAFTVAVSTREQAALRVGAELLDLFVGLSDGGQARLGAAAERVDLPSPRQILRSQEATRKM